MTKEEFIERAVDIKTCFLDRYFEENIARIYDSGIIDTKNLPEHYGGVYPAVAAILEEVAKTCIYGGSDGIRQRRITNKIKKVASIKR